MCRIAITLLIVLTLAAGIDGLRLPGANHHSHSSAGNSSTADAIEAPLTHGPASALLGGITQLELRHLVTAPSLSRLLPTPSVLFTLSYVLSFAAVFLLVLVHSQRRMSIALRRL